MRQQRILGAVRSLSHKCVVNPPGDLLVVEVSGDSVTVATMLGHSRIQMVLRYAHPTEQHQAEAAKRLEVFNTARAILEVEQLQAPTTDSTTLVNWEGIFTIANVGSKEAAIGIEPTNRGFAV